MSNHYNQYAKTQPILYITQPKSESIFVNMQGIFIGKFEKKERIEEAPLEIESVTNLVTDGNAGTVERDVNLIDEDDYKEEEKAEEYASNNRLSSGRKAFKEMDHREKVHFLLHKPNYIAKIPCEITTKDSAYSGIIKGFQGGKITLKSNGRLESVLIDMDEILEIKLATY